MISKYGQPASLALRINLTFHSSAQAFGKIMSMTKPRHAVAYHFYNEASTRYPIYEGIRETYDGPLSMADDMMVWNITRDSITERMAVSPDDGYKITYHAPQPRAVIEVVSPDDPDRVVDYGETGRVRLTTLTRDTFIPGFFERDEGEREPPFDQYPWDGVSGVRPFRQLAAQTTVGVY